MAAEIYDCRLAIANGRLHISDFGLDVTTRLLFQNRCHSERSLRSEESLTSAWASFAVMKRKCFSSGGVSNQNWRFFAALRMTIGFGRARAACHCALTPKQFRARVPCSA